MFEALASLLSVPPFCYCEMRPQDLHTLFATYFSRDFPSVQRQNTRKTLSLSGIMVEICGRKSRFEPTPIATSGYVVAQEVIIENCPYASRVSRSGIPVGEIALETRRRITWHHLAIV